MNVKHIEFVESADKSFKLHQIAPELQVAHLHTLAGFEGIQHVSISLSLSWLVLPNNFRFASAISSLNLVIILTTFSTSPRSRRPDQF